ncbi:MAG: 23S rRNA (adenine(2030)-N(6))-methyltransferase RlmJ [Chromatiales bacterium]|jgi:23S rRNA (adenine2030-N6)-methyltransferase|nr:23S rRNA (adenine(2030)-N(6))-methyltransferase RlmJ [Chromatiales bacterium]
MLSYQHEYHCGNHADVLKHSILALTIRALQRKDKPLRIIDAHAGSGIYELGSPEAQRNAEFRTGISRVLSAVSPPLELEPYLAVVRAVNPDGGGLSRYPGSPQIAHHLLRPQDHLELLELHPQAVARLRRIFGRDARIHIHDRDSYEGLPGLVPPPERRGLVLIDPAYEVRQELAAVLDTLSAGHARWPGGTWLIWYPLLRDPQTSRLPAKLAASGIRRIFRTELQVESAGYMGLRGSGLLIINPPYGLDTALANLLPWLWEHLANESRGGWIAEWLVGE